MEAKIPFPIKIYSEYAELNLLIAFHKAAVFNTEAVNNIFTLESKIEVNSLLESITEGKLTYNQYKSAKNALLPLTKLCSRIKEAFTNEQCPICFSENTYSTLAMVICCKVMTCYYCTKINNSKCIICRKTLNNNQMFAFELDSNRNPTCISLFGDETQLETIKNKYYALKQSETKEFDQSFFDFYTKTLLKDSFSSNLQLKTYIDVSKLERSDFIAKTNGEWCLFKLGSDPIRLLDINIVSVAALKDLYLVLTETSLNFHYKSGKTHSIPVEAQTSKIKVNQNRAFIVINGYFYEIVNEKVVKINQKCFYIQSESDWDVGDHFILVKESNYLFYFTQNGVEAEIEVDGEIDSFCAFNKNALVSVNGNVFEYSIPNGDISFIVRNYYFDEAKIGKIEGNSNGKFIFLRDKTCFEGNLTVIENRVLDFWNSNGAFCFKTGLNSIKVSIGRNTQSISNIEEFIDFTCLVEEQSRPKQEQPELVDDSNDESFLGDGSFY